MAEWKLEAGKWWYYYGPENKSRKRGKMGTCPSCGVSFPRRDRTLIDRKHGLRFCSKRCAGEHTKRSGPENPRWKGGREIDKDGYVKLWIIDGCGKRVYEHRMVMEQHLGRPLLKSETVHHINGDKQDNRIENLQLRIGQHGPHQAYRCMDCGSHRLEPAPIPGDGVVPG